MRRLAIGMALAIGAAASPGVPLAPAWAGVRVAADAAPPVAADAAPAVDAEAVAAVRAMAATLARAGRFAVTIVARHEVVQDDGTKIEFGSRRAVTVNRPAGLRVDARESDGTESAVRFDGRTITLSGVTEKVYAQVPLEGSTDDALRHMVEALRVRMPLALLFLTTLPDEVERRVGALALVETDSLAAAPADHIVARAGDVDVQVWIARAEPRVPTRIVITYREEPGQPQFRADLVGWDFTPDVSPARFGFDPPAGAERIPFMIRVEAPADAVPPTQAQGAAQ